MGMKNFVHTTRVQLWSKDLYEQRIIHGRFPFFWRQLGDNVYTRVKASRTKLRYRNSASRRRDAPDVTEYARCAHFSMRTRSFSSHLSSYTLFLSRFSFFLIFIFLCFPILSRSLGFNFRVQIIEWNTVWKMTQSDRVKSGKYKSKVEVNKIREKWSVKKKKEVIKIAAGPIVFQEDNIFYLRAKITRRGRGMKIGTKVAREEKGRREHLETRGSIISRFNSA